MNLGTAQVIQANARSLPLADNSVDLICTSPPYFALRSYQDSGEHYAGQIGDEPTPAEFVASLLEVTAECVRVLKPSGSLWVNLGDSYSGKAPGPQGASGQRADRASANEPAKATRGERPRRQRAEQFTREDAAWLAGVIDSDGSIGVHINKQAEGRAPSFVPWVRIGQMRSEVVKRAAELCGTGRVIQDGRGVWHWSASAQQARWVLERIHPWLLIKKRQAWAAIEVARHVEERNAKGSWRPLTADDIAYRQRLREAVMAWNQGTPDNCPVPEPDPVPLPLYPLAPRGKSLNDIPHMYAQECIGRLGLILRAEVIWSKPNGLPESVTDRVRRSHEQWFHFTLEPRYFSAVDEIREQYEPDSAARRIKYGQANRGGGYATGDRNDANRGGPMGFADAANANPLGKLPGSVWTIPTEPLRVPEHLGIDHFAAFPTEWPKRIIQGWSPAGVCVACGEGRRPILRTEVTGKSAIVGVPSAVAAGQSNTGGQPSATWGVKAGGVDRTIIGHACACGEEQNGRLFIPMITDDRSPLVGGWTDAPPTRPAVVLDPFGGTGTTALVAKALGRHGITVDMSADYCRLADWRVNDRDQLAKVLGVAKAEQEPDDAASLFDLLDGGAA